VTGWCPPERLVGDAVVLERVAERHTDGIHDAKVRSHPELRLWMDWAGDEPDRREESVAFVERVRAAWDDGDEFNFVMTDPGTGEVIGVCGLMTRRGPGLLEIGYWVRSDRAGAGVATAAAGLLTATALSGEDVGAARIHHDAANRASGRVAEKLGYTEIRRFDTTIDNPGECGVEVVWERGRAAPG
jgi:RimJ/RimL family protein N-acetyltransferase